MEQLKNLHPGNPKYYPYVPVAQLKKKKKKAYVLSRKMPKPGLVLKPG